MRQVVELRAEGWSLRAIAAHLDVHHDTIWRDLRRWDEARKVSDLPVGNPTPAVGFAAPESDTGNVVQLRRATVGGPPEGPGRVSGETLTPTVVQLVYCETCDNSGFYDYGCGLERCRSFVHLPARHQPGRPGDTPDPGPT
jgi:hypothetical protein